MIGHYPGVADANVYGVRLPNHDGRAGCVALVVHENHNVNFSSLARHLHNALPKYAVPLFIRLTKAITLTGNMKHQKHGMREEGVDVEKIGEKVLWLKGGSYVEFTKDDWDAMKAGQIKL